MAPLPELLRKETRPTGALVFIWILLLIPIGTCGGGGTGKLLATRAPIAHVAGPEALRPGHGAVGAFVETEATLTLLAQDRFPTGEGYAMVAPGYRAYAIEGAPDVVVISEGALASGRISGQICEPDAKLACALPKKELDSYVRSLQRKQKAPLHVLLANAKPGDAWFEAGVGLGVAGALLLLGLVTTIFLIRVARRPGRVGFARSVVLRQSPEDLRAKIRAQAGPLCRIAHDANDHVTVLVGKPAGAARLMGAREPQDIPLRVDVELGPPDAYRGTPASVQVQELLNRPPGSIAKALPGHDAPRIAAENAGAWMVALCESA